MRPFPDLPWHIIPAWLVGNRLNILMYHSISDNYSDPHAVSPIKFEHQMECLQSRKVISLKEGLCRLQGNGSLKDIWVITFDDGLLDFYRNALPVIKEFGYPVTLFVPTGLVGKTAVWDSYDKTKPLMNWEQLEECQGWNVSFGSHTVHHARLTESHNETLKNELTFSLQMLHERLENVLPALAYPGGYQDARVRQAALKAGYTCALGASSRWGNGPETDPFQLRRQRFEI